MQTDIGPFHLIQRDTLGYCSSARYLQDLEAPAMSMMADLAASEGLGYGQALTASEMAINAGSKTCLLLRLPLLIACQLVKSSKKCIYIYIYIHIIYTLKSSCVLELSTIHRMYRFLLFRVCPSDVVFFQAWPWVHRWRLWLWQQIGTILRFRWRVQLVHYSLQPWVPLHFEMSLMPVELERKQKESTTDAQTHRSTWKTKENVSKHIQNMFSSKKTRFQKQKNTNTTIWESAFPKKKNADLPCWFFWGVARTGNDAELWELHEQVARNENTKRNTKREQIRQKFWCFDDFDVFFCVLLILFVFVCFLWFLDFHRQLQMRVFLLVLEEVKWRGLAAWAYKSSLRFLDVHVFFLWHKNALWCTLLLCWVRWVL